MRSGQSPGWIYGFFKVPQSHRANFVFPDNAAADFIQKGKNRLEYVEKRGDGNLVFHRWVLALALTRLATSNRDRFSKEFCGI